jgi:hypothetical protein
MHHYQNWPTLVGTLVMSSCSLDYCACCSVPGSPGSSPTASKSDQELALDARVVSPAAPPNLTRPNLLPAAAGCAAAASGGWAAAALGVLLLCVGNACTVPAAGGAAGLCLPARPARICVLAAAAAPPVAAAAAPPATMAGG